MAITAAITLSDATIASNQVTTATCTVTNSGSTSVNVVAVQPVITKTGGTAQSTAVSAGVPPVGGAFPVSVAGSNGTRAISFDVVPFAPITSYNVGAEPSSFVYDVGAVVTTSDGATTYATTTTLTVTYPAT